MYFDEFRFALYTSSGPARGHWVACWQTMPMHSLTAVLGPSIFLDVRPFAESRGSMKAARIRKFGGPEVVVIDDLSRPNPGAGELLVRVRAAGVAPWDAIIREGKSKVSQPPPLTLGSDLSGMVEEVGPRGLGLSYWR